MVSDREQRVGAKFSLVRACFALRVICGCSYDNQVEINDPRNEVLVYFSAQSPPSFSRGVATSADSIVTRVNDKEVLHSTSHPFCSFS